VEKKTCNNHELQKGILDTYRKNAINIGIKVSGCTLSMQNKGGGVHVIYYFYENEL